MKIATLKIEYHGQMATAAQKRAEAAIERSKAATERARAAIELATAATERAHGVKRKIELAQLSVHPLFHSSTHLTKAYRARFF